MMTDTLDDIQSLDGTLGYLVQDLKQEIEHMEQLKAKFPPKGTLQDFVGPLRALQTVISFFQEHPELIKNGSTMDWLFVLVERMGKVEPYYPDQSYLANSIQRLCPSYSSLRCVAGNLQKAITDYVRSSVGEVTTAGL